MAGLHWGLYLILAAINVLAFIFVRYCLGKCAPDGFTIEKSVANLEMM